MLFIVQLLDILRISERIYSKINIKVQKYIQMNQLTIVQAIITFHFLELL